MNHGYSVRSATTGSFFAALLDGIIPEIKVSSTLITIRIPPTNKGSCALKFGIPVSACNIALIGIHKRYVTSTPSNPEENPIITVSALNILETFFFDAPIALKIPISLVRSCTDIKVITPIIIEDTTNDTATKAIKT